MIDTTSDVLVIGGNAAEIPQDGSVRALNGHSFFGRNIPHAELPEALVFLGDSSFVDSTLESVYIPGKINAILAFTFSGCRQLERVYIPRAVKTIDANAFHSCTSLKNIYYAGSEEEWNRIVVGENNAYLLNGEIHFNQTKSDYEAGIAK